MEYDGELLNGEKNGYGKAYAHGRLIYEGEFVKNMINGQGKLYDIRSGL